MKLNPLIDQNISELARVFQHARPFPFVEIPNFFTAHDAQTLVDQFPAFDVARAKNEAGEIGGKAVVEGICALGPAFVALDQLLQAPHFLSRISQITGIPDLLYDPYYFGGGTHENRHGQDLDPHVDFNRHPQFGWHRRLNLLVYLNHDWQPEWGGNFELHSNPRDPGNQVHQITPSFNHGVIFATSDYSWHGFSKIALPESERARSRKSIAVYFYTKELPADALKPTHSTIYVDRALPEQFKVGHTLSASDIELLNVASPAAISTTNDCTAISPH